MVPSTVRSGRAPLGRSPSSETSTVTVPFRTAGSIRETLPAMVDAGSGAILVTGNTASIRGMARNGFFASSKAAQRILAEAIAREFGPLGVHVAYFLVDAAIDTPRTRPTLAPDKPDEYFAKPAAIAEEMYRVAHQDRSTWSFLVELRPFGETW